MVEFLQAIPPRVRQAIYGTYVVVGFVLGAIQVGADTPPDWLDNALNVLGYAAIALGFTAAANASNVKVIPPAENVDGRHEAGSADLRLLLAIAVLALGFMLSIFTPLAFAGAVVLAALIAAPLISQAVIRAHAHPHSQAGAVDRTLVAFVAGFAIAALLYALLLAAGVDLNPRGR